MKDTGPTASFARLRLAQLIMGYGATQAIACIVRLGIADELADGPRTLDQLARATASSKPHLRRLMHALCKIGVFSGSDDGFHLTPISRHLCKDAADSLRPLADLHGHEMYLAFSKLLNNVRTGTPAWTSSIGASIWDYFREHPERGALFDETMRLNHSDDIHEMVLAYDFSAITSVADIGGGEGSLLRAILNSHASIRGVLVDLPEVISRTSESEPWTKLASRCKFVPSDFFKELPRDIDLYVLRHILHDWDDEHCVRILKQCRDSMTAGSRVLVIESLVESGAPHAMGGWSDLGMMIFGGEERTESQYEQLLAAAGLSVIRVIPCTRVTLIEARSESSA